MHRMISLFVLSVTKLNKDADGHFVCFSFLISQHTHTHTMSNLSNTQWVVSSLARAANELHLHGGRLHLQQNLRHVLSYSYLCGVLRASYTLQDVIGLKLFNRPSVIFGLNPCTHWGHAACHRMSQTRCFPQSLTVMTGRLLFRIMMFLHMKMSCGLCNETGRYDLMRGMNLRMSGHWFPCECYSVYM